LSEGNRVTLQNNKSDDLVLDANGKFTFARALDDESAYDVAIQSRQLKPKWSCKVLNSHGTLAGHDVTNVEVACFPDAILQAVAGMGKIDLKWNSNDFSGAKFYLCRAREEIPADGFGRCYELKGGVVESGVHSPQTLTGLFYDVPYWLQLEVRHPGGLRTYSKIVTATPFSELNDTGIDWCADNGANRYMGGPRSKKNDGCKAVASAHPGQDAFHGRDAAARDRKLSKFGSGSAGFDFTKVCMSGDRAGEGQCPPNPTPGSDASNWACTLDNVTGLIWEVKTTSGLSNQNNTYTWYNPDKSLNGGAAGGQNGGRCTGSKCDTYAYVKAVNAKGLCGAGDWRLPTREELLSIVDNGQFKPAVDQRHFPNTPASNFWSSATYADNPGAAWQVNFQYGETKSNSKRQPAHVRLVRKAQ
jgi:hypothetical protein